MRLCYGDRRDVLLIMSSGNDGRNVDLHPIYPAATDRQGRVCGFSNYVPHGRFEQLRKR